MQNPQLDEQFVEFVDEQGRIVTIPLHQFLQKKEEEARRKDQALGIQRAQIPTLFIELPDVPEHIDFQRLANAIGRVATCEHIAPETPQQGAWLRCVQFYWEAKAIVFANKIYKLILDPVQPGRPVQKILPPKALENLKLDVEADLAWYNLLKAGESEIKAWSTKIESMGSKAVWAKDIHYRFENFEQLFIETLRVDFEMSLMEGTFAPLPQGWNRKQERDHYRRWLKFLSDQFNGQPEEETYITILQSMGWKGYALLALRGKKNYKPFDKLWQVYLKKHRPLLKFLDSQLYWLNGVPSQSKQKLERRIKSRKPIQAIVTDDGYLDWRWLQDS